MSLMILLLSHIFCSIFAVLLRSTDEEVGRLVGEVKKRFEEKYHSCEAFREERLTGEKALNHDLSSKFCYNFVLEFLQKSFYTSIYLIFSLSVQLY